MSDLSFFYLVLYTSCQKFVPIQNYREGVLLLDISERYSDNHYSSESIGLYKTVEHDFMTD